MLTVVASFMPLLIGVYIVGFVDQFLSRINFWDEHKIIAKIFNNKLSFVLFQWFLSFLWLYLLKITLKENEQNKKVLWLLALIPIAFAQTLFFTFFIIYYSIVPFAP